MYFLPPGFLSDGWVLPSCSVSLAMSSQEKASYLLMFCRLADEELQTLIQVAQLQESF